MPNGGPICPDMDGGHYAHTGDLVYPHTRRSTDQATNSDDNDEIELVCSVCECVVFTVRINYHLGDVRAICSKCRHEQVLADG